MLNTSLPLLIFFLHFFFLFQAPRLPYSEITWPSANSVPCPSRCAPPLTALPHQRSLDLPSECPPPCPAHPDGRQPLRRVKSTMVWRSTNHRRQNSNMCTQRARLKPVIHPGPTGGGDVTSALSALSALFVLQRGLHRGLSFRCSRTNERSAKARAFEAILCPIRLSCLRPKSDSKDCWLVTWSKWISAELRGFFNDEEKFKSSLDQKTIL